MRLLIYPSNYDVFWIVFGWALLYGSARGLLTDGSDAATETFDDSRWATIILFGWPALYWLVRHGIFGLLD
jgi:hypothetical protein